MLTSSGLKYLEKSPQVTSSISVVLRFTSMASNLSEYSFCLGGKIWMGTMMLTMKKKMDANKKPAKDGEKKEGGFNVDFKAIKGMGQMLGSFTVLRLTSMMGMANISFTKEELLKMNAQLNKIRKPKK